MTQNVTFPDSEDVPPTIKKMSCARGMSRQLLGECHVSKNDMSLECHMEGVGEALVFLLKTSHQLKTGGLVYRPVPRR